MAAAAVAAAMKAAVAQVVELKAGAEQEDYEGAVASVVVGRGSAAGRTAGSMVGLAAAPLAGAVAKAAAEEEVKVKAVTVGEVGPVAQLVACSPLRSSPSTPRRPGCPGRDSHRRHLSRL